LSEDDTYLPVKTSKNECFPRKYAVKIVRNDDPEKISATRLEYDLLKNLKHPNIITVHDFFLDSFKNTAYLVMEKVEGCEVLELLSTSEHGLPESVACRLFEQLILAIDCLHKNRVCHRDIKPENILVTSDRQRVVLIDFNVSKKVLGSDAGLNMYTKCVGSIAFAAPERLKHDQ
jgi:serine/threonine protein kinase